MLHGTLEAMRQDDIDEELFPLGAPDRRRHSIQAPAGWQDLAVTLTLFGLSLPMLVVGWFGVVLSMFAFDACSAGGATTPPDRSPTLASRSRPSSAQWFGRRLLNAAGVPIVARGCLEQGRSSPSSPSLPSLRPSSILQHSRIELSGEAAGGVHRVAG